MTHAQHTPGPFEASGSHIYAQNGTHSIPLAHALSDFKDIAERDANARLFAAAPAMLAALERVAAWIDAGCDPSAKSIEAVRAAIAQARGTPTAEPAHPIPAAQSGEG